MRCPKCIIKCQLYNLVEVPQANAETLFNVLLKAFDDHNIPIDNIIGYASDTTNVMFGQFNSVVSCLKEKLPNIFIMRCICHTAHLCASHACEKLPRTAEELIHDICNYFWHSAKRQEQ
jgi:hypothetical protein